MSMFTWRRFVGTTTRSTSGIQVRADGGGNANATEAVLRVAALDPDARVREVVARNSNATKAARIVSAL